MNILDAVNAELSGANLPAQSRVPEQVELARVKTDGGTQMRASINWETVHEYADAMRAGATFPPITVYYDGTIYWLADGFHRFAAWKLAHTVPGAPSEFDTDTILAEVKVGGQRDATLHAASANAQHGLRRTNADKRRAVEVLLRDEEWRQWSDNEIARRCAVDPKTVGNIRREMAPSLEFPEIDTTRMVQRNGQTYQQNTTNIGANRPAQPHGRAEMFQIEAAVRDAAAAQHTTAADLRTIAKQRIGRVWQECLANLPDGTPYRDLVQGINNVAAQMELAARQQPAAPAAPAAPASPAGDTWALAWEERRYDKLTDRCERLAEAMLPWALAWTDDKGRTWRDVAERNPQHANSPFRQDVAAECQRRGIKVYEEALALAIRNLFGRLLATDGGDRPLPAWATEPEPQPDPEPTADDRPARLTAWIARLEGLLTDVDAWGDLTGHHSATLELERGAERMIAITRAELTALRTGRHVDEEWGVE